MSHDRDLDLLVALLEEHGIIPEYESGDRRVDESWGHPRIYERVRRTPSFPWSVDEVRALLERRPIRFS